VKVSQILDQDLIVLQIHNIEVSAPTKHFKALSALTITQGDDSDVVKALTVGQFEKQLFSHVVHLVLFIIYLIELKSCLNVTHRLGLSDRVACPYSILNPETLDGGSRLTFDL